MPILSKTSNSDCSVIRIPVFSYLSPLLLLKEGSSREDVGILIQGECLDCCGLELHLWWQILSPPFLSLTFELVEPAFLIALSLHTEGLQQLVHLRVKMD